MEQKWDVFISHASEDKDDFVRPLAHALSNLGVSVWYDEFSLQVGDSISRSIDRGLAESIYGLVIISPAFIRKKWPEYELRGLVSREISEDKVILPVWHGVTRDQVVVFSPTLADKLAIDTVRASAQDIAIQVLKVVRPDLYQQHSRAHLESLASGKAVEELQSEIERMREELADAREELSQFQCPYCHSIVVEQSNVPLDGEQKHWGMHEVYECGYESLGGFMQRPCPSDPRFPKLDEYEFQTQYNPAEPYYKWSCYASPKTQMARRLSLPFGLGQTEEDAKRYIIDRYNSYARRSDS